MSEATRSLWRTNPMDQLRDVGSIDIGHDVTVSAGNDEQQTPTVLWRLRPGECRVIARMLDRERLWATEYVALRHAADHGATYTLSMSLDDCSMLAGLLDDDGNWPDTVTALRKALGLAGCWVELQAGP